MHRVRQSINYFEEFGYQPTVMAVKPLFNENVQDPLLLQTIPANIKTIWVNAFASKWTRKIGLGALALRSMFFYFRAGNKLLKNNAIDLIYFSTTAFPLLILGKFWKNRFGIPYIIDMQDPWHSEYYQNKPKHERPKKYWFSYRLNKYLEPLAMKSVDGIIAVSQGYCDMLQNRYPNITPEKCVVIPFGAFPKDFEILKTQNDSTLNTQHSTLNTQNSTLKTIYIGRGGADMATSLRIIFGAFKKGLKTNIDTFHKIQLSFIGTSYAKGDTGAKTIEPIAVEIGVGDYVHEQPARVPYFDSLRMLQEADILLIPGSDDQNYTASKLYPYIMAKKPILAVFSETSSVINVLKETNAGEYVTFKQHLSTEGLDALENQFLEKWIQILTKLPFRPDTNWQAFEPYTAREMTKKQANFFDKILAVT